MDFLTATTLVEPFVSKDVTRLAITQIFVTPDYVVATDGHRLGRVVHNATSEVKKILSSGKPGLGGFLLAADDVGKPIDTIEVSPSPHAYPDYVIPVKDRDKCSILAEFLPDAAATLAALAKASKSIWWAGRASRNRRDTPITYGPPVGRVRADGRVIVQINPKNGSRVELSAEVFRRVSPALDGRGFQVSYLAEMAAFLPGGVEVWGAGDSYSPIVGELGDRLHVLMPCRG